MVASVGNMELLESEVLIMMKHLGQDPKDEKQFNSFIEQWTETALYEIELKERYPEKYKVIDQRANSFRGDHARFELEELSLLSKIDTVITKEEVQAYYDEHKEEFVLTDYLVRALYLKIPEGQDFKKKNIHIKYLLKNNKDLEEVNSYAKLYAENFYFNDSSWIYFSELTKDIPMKRFNKDNIVLNRTKTYFSEGEYTYFLNILDYQLKDDVPPIDFLENEIKTIVLNQRIQQEKEKLSPILLKELKEKYAVQINH